MIRSINQTLLPALALSAFVVAAPSFAPAQSNSDASFMEKHFVSEALKGGMAEVQMGQLAQQKSSSADVKEFGQRMVTDHTELGNKMKSVAQQIGVDPPSGPTLMQQAEIKKLQGLSGAEFDQEYIRAMVKDHEQDLEDFRKEANDGKATAVKAAASEGATVISNHLEHIRKIAAAHQVDAK